MEEFREEVLELAKKIYDAGVKKAEDEAENSDAYNDGLYDGFNFCKKLFFLSNKTKEKIFGTDSIFNIFKTYSIDEIKEALRNDANKHPIGTRVVTIEEEDPSGTPLFPVGTICRIVEYNVDDSSMLCYKLRKEDATGSSFSTWWYADNMFEVMEEEEALKVGDELEHKFNDFKAIVTRIVDDEYADVIYNAKDGRKGVTSTVVLSNYKRTGKNYSQLVELLNMLDNSDDEEEDE